MTEQHAIEIDDLIKGFQNEKTLMKQDFEEQQQQLKAIQAQELMTLGEQKD